MEVINAVGRRKQAIARVYLSDGKGNITINEEITKNILEVQFFNILLNNH